MTQTLNISEDGVLELNNEFVTIRDEKQRRNHRILHFSSFIWIIFGVMSIYGLRTEPDWVMLGLYGFITLVNAFLFIHYFRLTWAETVMLGDVKSAKVKTGWNNANLILKLKNGRIRKVFAPKERADELKTFVSANFPS